MDSPTKKLSPTLLPLQISPRSHPSMPHGGIGFDIIVPAIAGKHILVIFDCIGGLIFRCKDDVGDC